MSLRGYIPVTKSAPWMEAFPEQIQRFVAPLLTRDQIGHDSNFVKRIFPKRVYIRRNGEKRSGAQSLYRGEAREFIKECNRNGGQCIVVSSMPELFHGTLYGHPISARLNEVHHVFGKIGRLLRWVPGWMPVSKQGHRWIHANPEEARKRGWLGPIGTWNDFERAKAFVEQQQEIKGKERKQNE